jgi:hypothetical protein
MYQTGEVLVLLKRSCGLGSLAPIKIQLGFEARMNDDPHWPWREARCFYPRSLRWRPEARGFVYRKEIPVMDIEGTKITADSTKVVKQCSTNITENTLELTYSVEVQVDSTLFLS